MADCAIPTCRRPIADTAYVCLTCAEALETRLRAAADLLAEMTVTITRQDRLGDDGRIRLGSHEPPIPFRWNAADALAAITNTINTWARTIAQRVHADPPTNLDDLTRWVAGRTTWARYEPDAATMFDELDYAAGLVFRTVDRPAPRVDAGTCLADTGGQTCHGRLSAPPGASVIRCRVCGYTHDAAERRTALLAAARDQRGSATECARWLTWLGVPTTPAMVRGLAHRGRILADAWGRYRLGDVEACRRESAAA